jgi:glycosyltransferase involved in cell wall biosynthesis
LIVHAGGINPERDIETLIRAFARLSPERDLNLVIAGDGEPEYVAKLSGIARQLGIGDRVRFVGRLPQDQAIALMSLSSVGVVTLESNPLTELAWPSRIPEFALLRKPLVVPMLRFLAETLEDGAQFYIPGNAESLAREIKEALRAPNGRESAVAKAETICRRFEWGRMHTVLRGVYEALERSHAA